MVNNIMLSAMAWASSLRTVAVQRLRDERGQDLMEYAVLGGGIALALGFLFLVQNPLSGPINSFFVRMGQCMSLNATSCTR
ncbi:MAG: Flp family type IVb pilin [Candidatus Limnocylindria bacterium]